MCETLCRVMPNLHWIRGGTAPLVSELRRPHRIIGRGELRTPLQTSPAFRARAPYGRFRRVKRSNEEARSDSRRRPGIIFLLRAMPAAVRANTRSTSLNILLSLRTVHLYIAGENTVIIYRCCTKVAPPIWRSLVWYPVVGAWWLVGFAGAVAVRAFPFGMGGFESASSFAWRSAIYFPS